MQAYRHLACNTRRIKPHHNHVAGYTHIWWTRLLKARGLVRGPRNHHWHSNREPQMSSWAKSCGLTCMLICKATQTGKCWDEIKSILRLKLCHSNIHAYTLQFMEIQQKDNETLAAYIHCFETTTKQCTFNSDTAAIYIFVRGLWDVHTTAAKIYEKDPQTLAEGIRLVEKLNAAQQLTATPTPPQQLLLSSSQWMLPSPHVPWHIQLAWLHPIPHSPLLPQTLHKKLFHGPELLLLQQLPPHCAGNTENKIQATSKIFNPT